MVLELTKSAALLLALSLLQGFNGRLWYGNKSFEKIFSGLIYGGTCIIGMMLPIEITPGVIFDPRSVILSMAGLFGGPVVGFIAASTAGTYRAWLGGGGAPVGVAVVISCTALGLVYRYCHNKKWVKITLPNLFVFGLIVHIVEILLFTQLPGSVVQTVLQTVALPLIITFVPATALLGLILMDAEQHLVLERKLVASEARLSHHIENTPLAAISWDENFCCTEWNKAAENIFGYSVNEALGRHAAELVVPYAIRSEINIIYRSLLNQTGGTKNTNDNITKSGNVITCNWYNTPVLDENGKPVGVTSLVQDITELKRAVDNLRLIIDSIPMLITSIDPDGRYQLVNETCVQWYDRPMEEIVGKTVEEIHGSENEAFKPYIEKVLSNRKTETFEVTNTYPDGVTRDVALTFVPNLDPSGRIINFLSVGFDISDRKKVEETLRQSQKMEAVGQLTGGLAHDFNNLLGIMLGNAEMLQSKIELNDNTRANIEALIKTVEKGAALTQRLLVFSHQQPFSQKPLKVNELVLGLDDMLRRTLGETVELVTDLGTGIHDVLIDPHQFENALINLAINAKYAMPGGGELSIKTTNIINEQIDINKFEGPIHKNYVLVEVSDSGSGMLPEVLEKVFDPFFTTKDVGEGSGLGLSMVYAFVKQSNGQVIIQSEPDKGTTIQIYLPECDKNEALETKIVETLDFAHGSGRILVVEDDKNLREIPSKILRNQGYEVVEAGNGIEAIKCLKESHPFNLLFTDVVLPGGMNGVEIANQAKLIQPDIKVLLTSGYLDNVVDQDSLLNLELDLVRKPYKRSELLEKVQDALAAEDA